MQVGALILFGYSHPVILLQICRQPLLVDLIFPGRTANMLLEVFSEEGGVGKGKHIANLLHAVVARPQ